MDSKNSSIIALVCGILGIVGTFCTAFPLLTWLLFVCAVAGIIFGAIGMKKSKAETGKASGLAVGGLVCGIIGVVFGFSSVLCAACVCAAVGPLGCLSPDYATLQNAANDALSGIDWSQLQ